MGNISEGLFTSFFTKIGAEDVWNRYSIQYERYIKERNQCQKNPDKNGVKECIYISDLKLLSLKLRTLQRVSVYCKNAKDPSKCRRYIAKKIQSNNERLKLKRDALVKLHDRMNKEKAKEIENKGENSIQMRNAKVI